MYMENMNTKAIFIALIFLALFGMAGRSFADGFAPGLLYKDGIEPGDPSVCEAPAGSRCWWVDADAPAGGNGSYASPYNSFETVVGYTNPATASYVAGQISDGDYLYVKGTFSMASYDEIRHKTTIAFGRPSQLGSVSNPTVIKSWRGTARAVFDGEYVRRDLISVNSNALVADAAVKIQNVEVTRADGRGIAILENINSAEVINVVVHHTRGNGDGTLGGIYFRMNEGTPQYVLRNSLIYSNDQNPLGGWTNRGGISILSEGSVGDGSTITIHDNEIYNEMNAIRHKHSGNITFEAYNNLIHDSFSGFYLRAYYSNLIHHNVIYNVNFGVLSVAENQQGDSNAEIYHNTFYNSLVTVNTGTDITSYARNINFHDNISYYPGTTDGMIHLGRWNSNPFDINGWASANNIFYSASPGTTFLYHQGTPYNFTNGMAYLGDMTSIWASPQFQDAANHDFNLLNTSPAIGAGTGGTSIGAFEYASGGAEPDTTAPAAPSGLLVS